MEKLNITDCEFHAVEYAGNWFIQNGPHYEDNDMFDADNTELAENNAKTAAEGLNVANETGLTPRQLLEQRNELLEALKGMISIFPFAVSPEGKEIIEMTNTAIQNVQR